MHVCSNALQSASTRIKAIENPDAKCRVYTIDRLSGLELIAHANSSLAY